MVQHNSGQHLQFFEGRTVRTVWDDTVQEWYFSVADVVAVLTDSVDVKQYIKKMRTRDPELGSRWGTICTPTRMMASDGKYYNTQASNMEGIFRIIQSIPSPKAEPFKQWMSQVAANRINQMIDPELSTTSNWALDMAGRWSDSRDTADIVSDIRSSRTPNREIHPGGPLRAQQCSLS